MWAGSHAVFKVQLILLKHLECHNIYILYFILESKATILEWKFLGLKTIKLLQ